MVEGEAKSYLTDGREGGEGLGEEPNHLTAKKAGPL